MQVCVCVCVYVCACGRGSFCFKLALVQQRQALEEAMQVCVRLCVCACLRKFMVNSFYIGLSAATARWLARGTDV